MLGYVYGVWYLGTLDVGIGMGMTVLWNFGWWDRLGYAWSIMKGWYLGTLELYD